MGNHTHQTILMTSKIFYQRSVLGAHNITTAYVGDKWHTCSDLGHQRQNIFQFSTHNLFQTLDYLDLCNIYVFVSVASLALLGVSVWCITTNCRCRQSCRSQPRVSNGHLYVRWCYDYRKKWCEQLLYVDMFIPTDCSDMIHTVIPLSDNQREHSRTHGILNTKHHIFFGPVGVKIKATCSKR